MITIEQIKGARGLLEWTQDDLAQFAKISRPALTKIECRQTKPHTNTIARIQACFEKAGIEFISGGVRHIPETFRVRVHEGESAILRLFQDICKTYETGGGIARYFGLDEQKFIKTIGEAKLHNFLKNLDKLNIEERLIIQENDTFFVQKLSCYRWVSKEAFMQVPFNVYGDKFNMIVWEPVIKVIIIENAQIAASYRQHFDYFWEQASLPA